MAGDWITMRVNLARDPKVIAIADALASDRSFMDWLTDPVRQSCSRSAYEHVTRSVTVSVTVTALLVVWGTAREQGHAVGDDLRVTCIGLNGLDAIAGVPGFGEALAGVGWAVEDQGLGAVIFPKFFLNNVPRDERQRSLARDRQRRKREREGSWRNGASVKKERDISVTERVTVTPTVQDRKEQDRKGEKRGRADALPSAPSARPARARARRPAPEAPPLDPYLGVDIPPELDTNEFHLAWAAYCRMRRESGMPLLRRAGIRLKLAEWELYPVAVVVAALEESTLQQWRGVFPRKHIQRPREQRSFWEKSVGERLFEDIQREVRKHAPDRDEDPEASREREPEYETHGRNGPGVVGDAPRLLGRRALESGEGGGDAAALRRADGGRPDR